MDDDILSQVVEVEKEVQQRIEIEKKMSQEWLENVKKEAEEKVLIEEKELKKNVTDSISIARLNAEKKAEAIISDANVEAERIEKLDDDILKNIIIKPIIRILKKSSISCRSQVFFRLNPALKVLLRRRTQSI